MAAMTSFATPRARLHPRGGSARPSAARVLPLRGLGPRPRHRAPKPRGAGLGGRAARIAQAGPSEDELVPYQLPFPPEAQSEIFQPQAFPQDERVWVPQSEGVSFRPLCFNVGQGYYVNLLRVKKSGVLSRHRHTSPVHGYVLKGRWKYLEHDWEAVAGSYVFEPPGETHTLVVPEGVEEMVTLFHVTGSLLYCDPMGEVTGYEDAFSKLEKAKAHYAACGLGEDYALQFVR